jgi:cellulose biosynthesis protein BcsQ
MGRVIVFGNQKGGSGKSTLTTFFANALHTRGYKVAIIDTDFQQSINTLRKREVVNNTYNDELYDIIFSPISSTVELIQNSKDQYDYIFIDVPGNLTDTGTVALLTTIDIIVIVHDLSFFGFEATNEYLNTITKSVIPFNGSLKIAHIISKYNETRSFDKSYLNEMSDNGQLPGYWFKTQLRELAIFKIATTVEPYKHKKYQYEFDMLVDEFINVLK